MVACVVAMLSTVGAPDVDVMEGQISGSLPVTFVSMMNLVIPGQNPPLVAPQPSQIISVSNLASGMINSSHQLIRAVA